MILKEIEQKIKNSAFNKNSYKTSLPIKRFNKSIMEYIDEEKEATLENILKYGVPEFQRSNDKWNLKMKKKFVENVIKGYKTNIQLFILEEDYRKQNYIGCKIIDGLQRTTALIEFIEGKFKIFEDKVSFEEIKENILKGMNKTLEIEVFRFDKIEEAIDFYIEMNENITHSKEDIKKALEYKASII